MKELVRSNDIVFVSWLTMRLEQEDVTAVVLDSHMAIADGSIPAIQRRIMVADNDIERARIVLREADNL
ncbi:MAG: hypothetical protein CBB68_02995 [Rhodospirillaceae bacterium TMED8]|nr:hypothetical protein [Magnetovibrio sp.]OUT52334.1 MAG: hypothetical protein CBB68_02995 [Rhodospirillaceae bacterium TMED8]|tara:strand:+ start:640 stop:846 length:207 start_codon:yes stop_codon:yes gene_type:complete